MSEQTTSDNVYSTSDVSETLKSIWNELAISEGLRKKVETIVEDVKVSVIENIKTHHTKIAKHSRSVSKSQISESKQPADIEKTIRDNKLREAERNRKELEERLNFLNSNIEALTSLNTGASPQVHGKTVDPVTRAPAKLTKEEEEKKKKEAQLRIKKYNKDRAEKEKRDQEKRLEAERKMQRDMERRDKELKEKEEKLKEEKVRKMMEHQDRLKKMREERERLGESSKEVYKKSKQDKPLFMKIEERFQKQVAMPELEKRKKEISTKRDLYKPLNRGDLDSHERKVAEEARLKEEQLRREREERYEAWQAHQKANKMSESVFMRDMLDREKHNKEVLEQKDIERKELVDKKKKYAEVVKELHAPKIDKTKQLEMQYNIEKLKNPVKKKIYKHPNAGDESGMNVSQPLNGRSNYRPRRNRSANQDGDSSEPSRHSMSVAHSRDNIQFKKKRTKRATHASMDLNTQGGGGDDEDREKKDKKVVDYLKDMRVKREEKKKYFRVKSTSYSWEEDMQSDNVSKTEKLDKVKTKAQKIEEHAKKQEKLLKLMSDDKDGLDERNLDAGEQISDMYIESIKAKLAILGEMN
eukprot:CAMPEP_0115025222 /NCGR_PEP_ID=MMETSP0216-20121206/33837_1 /TAXON_ID=223996 /ORGANISM="Protocruzia adherens, Strain Boccale" /LENGTH=583 /DNA_ID=CAMNT_0002399695 /DNA_START=27 /DNA_END=1778 /DNA_ORIENTATION=+